jgi:hypothetical protein
MIGCSLHLHGHSTKVSEIYSTKTAVGIILASGNVGKQLNYRADKVNTYISRDAGHTWSEVFNQNDYHTLNYFNLRLQMDHLYMRWEIMVHYL